MGAKPTVDHLIPGARSAISSSDIDISQLSQLLALSDVERKVLLIAYRAKIKLWIIDHGSPWHVCFDSEPEAIRGLAELIEESADAVTVCFAPPCRLQGLGLLALCAYYPRTELIEYLRSTPRLMDILAHTELSQVEVLERLHQVPIGIEAMRRHPPTLELLYEWFPLPLAQAYERALAARPTTGQDVAVLASWFSGCDFSTAECEHLAGRLEFNEIQQVVHRITLKQCLAGQVLTRAHLFECICAAAR